ncbi:MAG: stage IV sporulation protein A [Christensenellales bacterium]
MNKFNLLEDIAKRTGGDVYVGVVGPVRTGKSTFIKRFMESFVIDNIADPNARERTIDELPQSADGKTIMTTQPRFVPNEAVKVTFNNDLSVSMRMIDCVGYVIDGAVGHKADGKDRMVRTPWSNDEMPFEKAAELGTEKVIKEHSTIGVLLTTDGSIGELEREKYISAEERVAAELKEMGKPFVVVLNSTHPESEDTLKIKEALQAKYDAPVIAVDVLNMTENNVSEIMESVLLEFPIKLIDAVAPKWIQALDIASDIVGEIIRVMDKVGKMATKLKDYVNFDEAFDDAEYLDRPSGIKLDAGAGRVEISMAVKEGLFYRVASDECGERLSSDYDVFRLLKSLSRSRAKTAKLDEALKEAEETGYGVVAPLIDDMELDEPEIVKQGGQFGVKLKAKAPSLHIIKVDVETEVSPIVGSEQQSDELVKSLMNDFEGDKAALWETNIFGKSLSSLVNDGLQHKLSVMPIDARQKMQKTLGRIINEGKGGVLCILL